MFVEEFNGAKGAKYFRYKIGDKEIADAAGAVLCELLNCNISYFLYDYQCYLHSGEIKFKKRVEHIYNTFSPTLQYILKDIFPMNFENVSMLEEIDDLVKMISSKIASNDDASYDFFIFALMHFYGYKPPIFPIQKYKISFLNFICPLIEYYIPFKIHTDDYQKTIKEIDEIDNIPRLETLLLALEKLIEIENLEQNNIRTSMHSKHVRDLIMWYCMDELQKYNCLPYDMENSDSNQSENTYNKIHLEQLEKLNANTTFVMVQRMCEESAIPYKHFFINLLYSYNKSKSNKNKVYYLKDSKELICHGILYCFKDNHLPIKQCKYCKRFYARTQNSQTVCLSCKGLNSSMTSQEQKEVFGEKIEVLLTRVYRKLCYKNVEGKPTFTHSKYTYDKSADATQLSYEQSRILVDSFAELIRKYKRMGYEYIERYKMLDDPILQKDYATFVKQWMLKIDEYYTSKNIQEAIKCALEKDCNNPVVIITEFSLNAIEVDEKQQIIPLYIQK